MAFICRQPLKQVVARFACLIPVEPNFAEEPLRVAEAEKAGEKIEQVSSKLALVRELGYEPEVTVSAVQLGGEKQTIVLYDFGPVLNPVLPKKGSSYYPTVYAVILNKSKMIDGFYEGVSDYFFMRELSLKGFEITVNANKTTYASPDEKGALPGILPATKAPEQGRIAFSDLKRNDRVSIIYRVGSRYDAYPKLFVKQVKGKHLIHLVKFDMNGELAEDKTLIHVMENGGYREA